jgi:hypothetical protein
MYYYFRGGYMKLGKLLKIIFGCIATVIIVFFINQLFHSSGVVGFMVGVVWSCIYIYIVGDKIPRDKIEELNKIKNGKL